MSEVNTVSSAAVVESSATTQETQNNQTQAEPSTNVDKRIVEDMVKYKKLLQERDAEVQRLRQEQESFRIKQMKEKDDWKGVAAEKERTAAEFEQRYSQLKESIVTTHKADAVKLAALKAGLSPGNESLLEMMPMDEVQVEFTSNGRMLTHGADEFVAGVRMKYPSLFSKPAPTGVNSGGVSGVAPESNLTAEYMVSLEKSDPAKYKALMPAFLAARRKK